MTATNPHPKITAEHRSRKALVYIRQSSIQQVRENLESQRLQYGLAERARRFGFQEVEVIDSDLGCSASIGAATRAGFERVISAVAMGEVGLLLSREVSRLSRTDKDWCHLLEVCQIFGTLIGDEEQIYDLSTLDDQLVLGIKGTLSVIELKVLRLRMEQGREEKARRGELLYRLPTGYVKDADHRVILDPDQRIQQAIHSIFRKFRDTCSLRQTWKWFRDQEIELPTKNPYRPGKVRPVWKLPSLSFIVELIKNPFYAGAYVYGRRSRETILRDGRLIKRAGRLRPAEQCRVFIPDHHEGYISWETFQENLAMIQRNNLHGDGDAAVAAVRRGQGLLAGLLRCGHCGRKLHVRYWGKSGTIPRYFCQGDYDNGGSYCVSFSGLGVDYRFSEEILELISPLGVEASLEALKRLQNRHPDRRRALTLQLQQLDYETQRAFEQYDEVDPRNRLVAAELERRWNTKMEERDQLRASLASLDTEASLSSEERERILQLGQDFAEVWEDELCPMDLKKKIVHALIEEVTVTLAPEPPMLHFVIHWKGGRHNALVMEKPRSPVGQKTSVEALEIIRSMAVRYGDDWIAAVLNRNGLRTGKNKRWSQTRVATARRNHSIPGQRRTIPDPGILSLKQAANYAQVSQNTILRLGQEDLLPMKQCAPLAPWEIRKADLEAEPVRGILKRLRKTRKLSLPGDLAGRQGSLLVENKGNDNERHYD